MAQPSGQVALAAGNAAEYFWYAQSTGIWDAKNSVMLTKTGSAGMSSEGGANVAVGDAATSYALQAAINMAGPWTVIIRCRNGATAGSNGMIFGDMSYDNYLWLRQAAGILAMSIEAVAGSANPTADVTTLSTWGLVFNSGVLTFYKDGTSIGTSNYSGGGHLKLTKLLAGYAGGFGFDGVFECANIIPSALTSGQITTRTADLYAVLASSGGTNASDPGGSGTSTGSGSGGDATGGSGGTNASDPGGTGISTGSGSGGTATGAAGGTGSFTSDVLVNNTGTVLASTTVYWSWWQGAIGATPTSLTHGSSVTNASGIFTVASLPTGAGFMLARDASGATVYYQPGTI